MKVKCQLHKCDIFPLNKQNKAWLASSWADQIRKLRVPVFTLWSSQLASKQTHSSDPTRLTFNRFELNSRKVDQWYTETCGLNWTGRLWQEGRRGKKKPNILTWGKCTCYGNVTEGLWALRRGPGRGLFQLTLHMLCQYWKAGSQPRLVVSLFTADCAPFQCTHL